MSKYVTVTKLALIGAFLITLLCIGSLTYVWTENDTSIDRANKIGFSVFLGSILISAFAIVLFLGVPSFFANNIFSVAASSGYQYPTSLRSLLFVLAAVLTGVSIFLLGSDVIANQSSKMSIVSVLGIMAIACAGLGLYYQTSFLEVNWEQLRTINQRKQAQGFFDMSLIRTKEQRIALAYAIQTAPMSNTLKDILINELKESNFSPSEFFEDLSYVPTGETLKGIRDQYDEYIQNKIIFEDWPAADTPLSDAFSSIGSGISSAAKTGYYGIKRAGSAVGTTFQELSPRALAALKTAGSAVGSGLKTAGVAVGSGLKTAGVAVGSGLKTGAQTGYYGVTRAGSGISQAYKELSPRALASLQSAGTSVKSGLGAVGSAIGTGVGSVGSAIGTGIENIKKRYGPDEKVYTSSGDPNFYKEESVKPGYFSELSPRALAALQSAGTSIKSGLGAVGSAIGSGAENVKDFFTKEQEQTDLMRSDAYRLRYGSPKRQVDEKVEPIKEPVEQTALSSF